MRVGLLHFLTLLFVILKLTDTIAWSWWWVMSPSIFCLVVLAIIGAVGLRVLAKLASKDF